MTTLHHLVAECALKYPGQPAAIFDSGLDVLADAALTRGPGYESSDGTEAGRLVSCEILTYSQLWARAQEICSFLTDLGVKNEVVAVLLSENCDLPVVLLGILSSSCAFFPLSQDGPRYTSEALSTLRVSYIIVHRVLITLLSSLLIEFHWSEVPSTVLAAYGLSIIKLNCGPVSPAQAWQNLAYCITTSGTTNSPKVVSVPHKCIVPNILHLSEMFHLGPRETVLLTSPLTFDPSIIDIFCTLTSGACLLIIPREVKQSPDKLLNMICKRHPVSVMQATPSLIRRFSPAKLQQSLLSSDTSLRVLALGGEAFPGEAELNTWLPMDNRTTQFYNLYGITEVSCWASCCHVKVKNILATKSPVSIGAALPKTSIIVKPDEASDNVKEGDIYIGSAERICYIAGECKHTGASDDGMVWRNSGDRGLQMDDGSILCLGRRDDQVKRNGKRLNLSALEQVCKELSWLADCSAVLNGARLIMFVVLDNVLTDNAAYLLSQAELDGRMSWTFAVKCLKKHLKAVLPSHYMPDHFVKLDGNLPVTSHGKSNRKLLKRMAAVFGTDKTTLQTCPSTWAKDLWISHLPEGVKNINSWDTFVGLGGDSLAAARMLNMLESIFLEPQAQLFDALVNKDLDFFVTGLRTAVETCTLRVHLSSLKERQRAGEDNVISESSRQLQGYDATLYSSNSSPVQKKRKTCWEGYITSDMPSTQGSLDEQNSSNMYMDSSSLLPRVEKSRDLWIVKKIITRGNRTVFLKNSNLELLKQTLPIDKCVSSSKPESLVPVVKDNSSNSQQMFSTDSRNCDSHHEQTRDCTRYRLSLTLDTGWKFDTKKCVDASPCLAVYETMTVAYIGSHSGQFSAFNVRTGQCLWTTLLPDRIESSGCCSMDGKLVIVGCYSGSIFIMEAISGHVVWEFPTGDAVKCSPVVMETSGFIVCGSHDGCLYCLDCQRKKCVWQRHLGGGGIFSSPAVDCASSIVYAASLGGKLVALCANTGNVTWEISLGKPIFSSLCLLGQSVLVGCVDAVIYCVDSLARIVWSFKTEGPIFSTPVVNGGAVFIGSHDHHIYCLHTNGKLKWKFKTSSTVYSTGFVSSMPTLVADPNARCLNNRCYERADGHTEYFSLHSELNNSSKVLDSKQFMMKSKSHGLHLGNSLVNISRKHEEGCTSEDLSSSETVVKEIETKSENLLCLASTDGNLYLVRVDTGNAAAQFQLPGEVFSSPVISDNHQIIVGCRDNYVYSLDIHVPSILSD